MTLGLISSSYVHGNAKFHYASWFEPAWNQLRTSSESAPNQLG